MEVDNSKYLEYKLDGQSSKHSNKNSNKKKSILNRLNSQMEIREERAKREEAGLKQSIKEERKRLLRQELECSLADNNNKAVVSLRINDAKAKGMQKGYDPSLQRRR